jgi:hypothetical protein
VELYDQDAKARLLSALIRHLDRRGLIDVGAEWGDLAEELRASAEDCTPSSRALSARCLVCFCEFGQP